MIILPEMAMKMLMSEIVTSCHGLVDENGVRVPIGTIDEKALRMAAISAIQSAIGDVVWPRDRKITVVDRPTNVGIFEFRNR